MKRVAIYLRVSTSKQETGNQRRELEAVAKRSWLGVPEHSCARTQRGCLPRPDQVSEGFSGLQYFGRTIG